MNLRDRHEDKTSQHNEKLEITLSKGEGEGTFSGFVSENEGQDAYDEFYQLTGLSKDEWELDKGSLTVKLWQQSRRTDDGDRDVVWLRSYGGKLRLLNRPELSQEDVESLLNIGRRYPQIKHKEASDQTRIVLISDLQVGKQDRRGGTSELIARVSQIIDNLNEVMAENPCSRCVVVDPGDLIEGFENTSSQQFTNDLSHPEMLRVARSILTDIVATIASQHESVLVATCPSNHGAWRRGKGSLGRPGDDYGVDVHLSVKEALERDPRFQNIEWKTPESLWDEITFFNERGFDFAVTHGHQARTKKFEDYWRKQAGTFSQAHNVDIVYSGHYHSFISQSLGLNAKGNERLHIQAPAMDNGSTWWYNISGDQSKPGIVTHILDDEGWKDIRLITSDS